MFDPIKKAEREMKRAARQQRQQEINELVREMRLRIKSCARHHLWPLFAELAELANFALADDAVLDDSLRKQIYYHGAMQLHPDASGDDHAFKRLASLNTDLKKALMLGMPS